MGNLIQLEQLAKKRYFNRTELFSELESVYPKITDANFKVKLQEMLRNHQIARVGRNAYCVCNDLRIYSHEYSKLAAGIAQMIDENHKYLDFRVFELIQLNEFLNHQIAHNTVFVAVESDLEDFVFDDLKEKYGRQVLINPSVELYHQYLMGDMIVVYKLCSETPKGKQAFWHTDLEKILVDIVNDKIIKSTFSESEYPQIFESAFDRYVIDESQLFRYARRRTSDKKIKELIQQKTKIELRLEQRK